MIQKYRAWHIKEKKMYVVLDLHFDMAEVPCVTISNSQSSDGLMTLKVGKDVVLMQSTGLKDKNGVEIFEGDIAINEYECEGKKDWVKIVFEEQEDRTVVGIGFHVISQSDKRVVAFDIRLYRSEEGLEVIGNIHEHRHLLKGDKDGK